MSINYYSSKIPLILKLPTFLKFPLKKPCLKRTSVMCLFWSSKRKQYILKCVLWSMTGSARGELGLWGGQRMTFSWVKSQCDCDYFPNSWHKSLWPPPASCLQYHKNQYGWTNFSYFTLWLRHTSHTIRCTDFKWVYTVLFTSTSVTLVDKKHLCITPGSQLTDTSSSPSAPNSEASTNLSILVD